MSDLTKRLREITRIEKLTSPQQWDVDEAADLIERLSAQLAEAERKIERLKFHAEAMAVGDRLAAKDYVLNGDAWNARAEYLQAVKRYRADKEAK